MLGDFNTRSTSWWADDKSTIEGTHLETITFSRFWTTNISPCLHIFKSSSTIDLIFTDQHKLVVDCRVHTNVTIIGRVTQYDSMLTHNWKNPGSNSGDALNWALKPNLVMRLPVTFRLNKIKYSYWHQVSEAASSLVT